MQAAVQDTAPSEIAAAAFRVLRSGRCHRPHPAERGSGADLPACLPRCRLSLCSMSYANVCSKGQTKSLHVPQCCKPFVSQQDFTGQLSDQKGLSICTHPLHPIASRKLQSLHSSPHLDSIMTIRLLFRTAAPAASVFPFWGRSLQIVQSPSGLSHRENIPPGLCTCRRCRPGSRASAP